VFTKNAVEIFVDQENSNQTDLKKPLLTRMNPLLAVVPLSNDLTIRNIAFSAASLRNTMGRNEDLMSSLCALKISSIP